MAHELTHTLGTTDIYGAKADHARRLSLMGPTIGEDTNHYDRATYHLDPWHKMRLGWLRPRVIRLDLQGQGCQRTAPAPLTGDPNRPVGNESPVLFYSDARGINEFYLVENRTRSWRRYDDDVASEGVALWLVQTNNGVLSRLPGGQITPGADGVLDTPMSAVAGDDDATSTPGTIQRGPNRRLDTRPAATDDVGEDRGNVSIGPRPSTSAAGWPFSWGGGTFWGSANGEVRPLWVNGATTGLRLRFGSRINNTWVEMEWSARGAFTPSISSRSPTFGPPGTSIRLYGGLGVRGAKRVFLRNSRGSYAATILDYRCDTALIRIPSGVPRGVYNIVVQGDSNPVTVSNGMPIEVTG